MTAEENELQKVVDTFTESDRFINYVNGQRYYRKDIVLKAMQSYAESLAKERAVEFYISQEFTDGMYVVANPDHFPNVVKEAGELYDTFLADKRKEGAE